MDLQNINLERIKTLVSRPRHKAIGIAILIATVIVLMQVNNTRRNQPMCELLADCKLHNSDMHRIQLALGQAGLSKFKIEEGRLLVPQAQHAQYLQAVADHDAIPEGLRPEESNSAASNPFLSRSQQLTIQKENKRRQIQEMVVRLPFVDQAWFEMDAPESHSAFAKQKTSAVVSIQPIEQIVLIEPQIDTIRHMIGGAIAGIDPSEIVVIDLSSGLAQQPATGQGSHKPNLAAYQVAFVRQQSLQTRIRNSLSHYQGLQVAVIVEPAEVVDQVAVVAPIQQPQPKHIHPSAGANGQVSLASLQPQVKTEIATVSHESNVRIVDHVKVIVDVPDSLVATTEIASSRLQASTRQKLGLQYPGQGSPSKDLLTTQYAQLTAELESVIRPLVGNQHASIHFNRIPSATKPMPAWMNGSAAFAKSNWPSLAVLGIGVMLIFLVTQSFQPARPQETDTENHTDILTLHSEAAKQNESAKRKAEVRLSQVIEKDPDAAAKVIENWIRDAA